MRLKTSRMTWGLPAAHGVNRFPKENRVIAHVLISRDHLQPFQYRRRHARSCQRAARSAPDDSSRPRTTSPLTIFSSFQYPPSLPRERHRPFLHRIVREPPHVAAVRAHHEDVGRRLPAAAARHFVRTRRVPRTRSISIGDRTACASLPGCWSGASARAIGTDRVDLVVAVAVAREGNQIAVGDRLLGCHATLRCGHEQSRGRSRHPGLRGS